MTISRLPPEYSNTTNVTLNDRDVDVTSRNAIMPLIALVVDDAEKVESAVCLLVQEMCSKTSEKPD